MASADPQIKVTMRYSAMQVSPGDSALSVIDFDDDDDFDEGLKSYASYEFRSISNSLLIVVLTLQLIPSTQYINLRMVYAQ